MRTALLRALLRSLLISAAAAGLGLGLGVGLDRLEHARRRAFVQAIGTDLWVPVQGVGLVGVTFAQTPSLETLCARAFGVPESIFRYPDGSRLGGCYNREFRHVYVIPDDRQALRHELCHASHGHFHGDAAEDAYRDRPLPRGC